MHPAALHPFIGETQADPGPEVHDRERFDEDASERVNVRITQDDDVDSTYIVAERGIENEGRVPRRQIAYTIDEYDWSDAIESQSGHDRVGYDYSASVPRGALDDFTTEDEAVMDERFATGPVGGY